MALADIVEAIAASPKLSGVTVLLGAEFRPEHGAPPRIVLVPSTLAWAPRVAPQGFVARTKGSLQTTLRAHIWAAAAEGAMETSPNMRAAERLMNALIWAVAQVANGSFTIVGGEWDQDPGVLQLGRHIMLDIRFDVPVIEPEGAPMASATATITDVDQMTGDIIP